MLVHNIKKIFEELDDEALRILSIFASNGEMTAYEVWKESRQKGKKIPLRTVYGKSHWLSRKDQGYIVEAREEPFKRRLVKVYYDVTLKGMLAALGDENLSFDGIFLEKLRMKLHVPKIYEKTVKPIVSIWAYFDSRLPKSKRHNIDETSIFESVVEMIATWKDIGFYSTLRKELGLPSAFTFKEELNISDEEYEVLDRFVSTVLLFEVPTRVELRKRTLSFAINMMPTPYLSDCIEILPDFAIRVFWATFGSVDSLSVSNQLNWLYSQRDVTDFISKGDRRSLDEYLKHFVSTLRPSWLLSCFRLQLDGSCSWKNSKCPFSTPLDCDIIREHANLFKTYLDLVIERLTRKLDQA